MMLHNDEGYQKDVGDPKAMDAVLTELRQHPDRLPRYPFHSGGLVGKCCVFDALLLCKLPFACNAAAACMRMTA